MSRLHYALAISVLLTGCGRDDIKNKESVKQGVIEYLNNRKSTTGLDMDRMDLDVTSVAFQNNEAHATVAFRVKGEGPAGAMSMNYVLQRRGPKWVVSGTQQSSPHGGGATPALPPNHPPVEGAKPEAK